MAQHIFTGTGAPSAAPTAVGQHYIDTAAGVSYISVGTSSTTDWETSDATAAVAAHVAASDPHTQYTRKAQNLADLANAGTARSNLGLGTAAVANSGDFDAAGTASSAVAAHVGATDPHPQYLTAAEGNAAYDAIGAAAAAQAFAIQRANHTGTQSVSTLTGTLPLANGGTGQTTANDALNALLPSQTGNAGKILETDGTNSSWVTNSGGLPTGSPNQLAYFDPAGDLASSAAVSIDPVSGGLIENASIDLNNETGGFQVNRIAAAFNPLQNSPDLTWNLWQIDANIDPALSGFTFGTNGGALNALNLSVRHVGTSDVGGLAMLSQYFEIGNGTDPIDVKGISYHYGFGVIRSGVNLNGSVQGYGFQPNFETGSTIDPSIGINAFYDFAQFHNTVPGYNSFAAGPQIDEVANNFNYVGVSLNPQITNLAGNAGVFGIAWSPQIGTVNSGSVQGISLNPTVTLNKGYAAGLNINMSNVTNDPGVKASVVVQDITYQYNQAGTFGNTLSVEYLDTTTAGNEVASLLGGNTVSVTIESGVSTATQILAAINAVPAIITNMLVTITGTGSNTQTAVAATPLTGGVDPGRKYAIDVTGDVNIVGSLAFTGGLSLGAISSFAPYTVASGSGVASVDTLITAPQVAASATITGTDLLAINTAMLLTIGDNASVTSNFLGYAALGLPAVLSMGTGATIDRVAGAVFAISLDTGATGGTVDEVDLCRAISIPNGVTTVTKLRAYQFDLPFGDPGTTTWGVYMSPATAHNYMAGDLVVGTADVPTNSSVGIEIVSTTKAMLLSRMSSTEEAALTAVDGMIIYNTTTNKFRGYENGAWVDLV